MNDKLNLLETDFGEYIDKDEADVIFNQGGKIEKEKAEILKGAIKDEDGKDYYASPAYAFIFSHSKLKKLLDKMNENSCLILLKGARPMVRDGKTTSNGRPTLIAMVYQEDGDYVVLDQTPLDTTKGNDIGTEHPGGYPPGLLNTRTEGIPMKILKSDIVHIAMH